MRIERLLVLVFAVFASVFAWGVAQAQMPSALVLEKSGASAPEVQPYSEIPVGTTISLSRGAKLVFLHYYTCQAVAVVGSTIRFGAETYTITGGKKESERRSPCPQKVALKAGGEMGGIMVRSLQIGSSLKFSTRPAFVLVGKRADEFASVRVSKEDKVLLKVPLEGRRFRWPSDAAPLSANTYYRMVLIPTVSGAAEVKTKFFVTARTEAPAGKGMVLIRVE